MQGVLKKTWRKIQKNRGFDLDKFIGIWYTFFSKRKEEKDEAHFESNL